MPVIPPTILALVIHEALMPKARGAPFGAIHIRRFIPDLMHDGLEIGIVLSPFAGTDCGGGYRLEAFGF